MMTQAVACPECGERFTEAFEHCPQDGSKLGQLDALCGRELGGRYFVLARMGAGTTGAVYAASDERLHRRVAVKVLKPEIVSRSAQLERFRQELRTLSSLAHEHIADVSDLQRDGGAVYFAMEYLRGQTLEALLERAPRLEVDQMVHIVEQCCWALFAAHTRGVFHRDLKPANVFLTHRAGRSDYVKLLDFGIAPMLYAEGESPASRGAHVDARRYMSPEQAEGRTTDGRSDEYALGVMMFQMLTGSMPYADDPTKALLEQHVPTRPRRFESIRPGTALSQSVEAVVRKALASRPEERFPDVAILGVALRNALRARRDDQLQTAFQAYNVPLPSTEARRRLATLDEEVFALLETLRRTLADDHQRALADQREAFRASERALEQRVSELEAQRRELHDGLLAARGDRPSRG